MPQTLTPALYGRPDGPDVGFPVTKATLTSLSGGFKLLISEIITSMKEWARVCRFSTSLRSISAYVFSCTNIIFTQSSDMDLSGSLYGSGERGEEREVAFVALSKAIAAIARLDADSTRHPMRNAWLRVEREVALVAAAREAGIEADPQSVLAARLGALTLPRGHVQLGDLDDRARRWAPITQRKGPAELRALVAELAPSRGVPDMVGLAERVAQALQHCAQASWEFKADPLTGTPILGSVPAAPGAVDAGDLALALPWALRRIGLTTTVLPGLVSRPRLFAREDASPLAALTDWAAALERQAGEGASRLRELELYAVLVERKLGGIRRPAALRRLLALVLGNWSVWAAKLARDTKVDISSAWRTLEQAADLGLVLAVSGQKRSRGDGTLYVAPPLLRMAGLLSLRRGRPVTTGFKDENGTGLSNAIAELDAAVANADRLIET